MTTTELPGVTEQEQAAMLVDHWHARHRDEADPPALERLVCRCGRSWLLACEACSESLIVLVDGEPCLHALRHIA